ncbi:MAG: hypothetical protein ACI9IP_002419 [Arcticibacterium sp.]|jgi:hypothetical protein
MEISTSLEQKAYFKSKLVFRFALFYSLIATLSVLITYKYPQAYIYVIWSFINGLIFIVLLSKNKNTLCYLKVLSAASIAFICSRYVDTYIIQSNVNGDFIIERKDVTFIAVYLIFLLRGEQLIEIRTIKSSAKSNS